MACRERCPGCSLDRIGAEILHTIPPDLPLATAPIRHRGVCYTTDRAWIILARTDPQTPVPVGVQDRALALKQPCLTFAAGIPAGLTAGYINLTDQPTPRHLNLRAGTARDDVGTRALTTEDIAEEGLLLVRTLPLFFSSP